MELLLHACCAPCLSGSRIPYEEGGYDVKGFWYNPNIQPWKEYDSRLKDLERYSILEPIEIVYDHQYPLLDMMLEMVKSLESSVKNEHGAVMDLNDRRSRCKNCYQIRIKRCAQKASDLGVDAFSTTLLISKYQNHDLVKEVCEEASERYGVKFPYRDLRKYWGRSLDSSRKLRLYRQQYCGCVFSEAERYEKEINAITGSD